MNKFDISIILFSTPYPNYLSMYVSIWTLRCLPRWRGRCRPVARAGAGRAAGARGSGYHILAQGELSRLCWLQARASMEVVKIDIDNIPSYSALPVWWALPGRGGAGREEPEEDQRQGSWASRYSATRTHSIKDILIIGALNEGS